MMGHRKMLKAERDRKAAIRRIRRRNFVITRLARGRYKLALVIDHQSFEITRAGEQLPSHRVAWFYATQCAIALHRFKFGD
jgi:hypothetical protein